MRSGEKKMVVIDGTEIELIYVAGGELAMGSEAFSDEKPVHQVQVDSFLMGKYPVTQELWQRVMGDNPSRVPGNKRPVEKISWKQCRGFIAELNRLTGEAFRLPTEAEWEYAARGGRLSRGFRYSGSDKLEEVGWSYGNSYGETKPVGLKLSNELDIHDMSGNVWEWCEDWYGKHYYQGCAEEGVSKKPKGPDSGGDRVLRGGSYFNDEIRCRCTNRDRYHPEYGNDDYGFRLAVSVSG